MEVQAWIGTPWPPVPMSVALTVVVLFVTVSVMRTDALFCPAVMYVFCTGLVVPERPSVPLHE